MVASRLLGFIQTGNSIPIIVEADGQKYFLKLRKGISGTYGLLNEWIGNKAAQQLGLNAQHLCWIQLNEELEYGKTNLEVKQMVQNSIGINLGFEFLEDIRQVTVEELSLWAKDDFADIFLHDWLMLNVDRSPKHLNLLMRKGQVIPADYEASLFCTEVFEGKFLYKNSAILKQFKAHPFYQKLSMEKLKSFVADFQQLDWNIILSGIPKELLGEFTHQDLFIKIQKRNNSLSELPRIFQIMESISLETKAEEKARIRRNRDSFEQKIKGK